jgi:hypothetical protein
MQILQYAIILFVIFAGSRALLQYRQRNISFVQFLFWESIWLVLLVFGLFPDYFGFLSRWLGIERIVDAIVYLSIGLMFYLIYRLYIIIENLRKDMTKLVRSMATENAKKSKKSKE